tara:strand:+ start:345 stop:602 length:258 start_codon:yes stop_codon:yes gene_type:complete
MGTAFTKGPVVTLEPMNGQHKLDPLWNGVTAEIMDADGEMWKDVEGGLVKLQPPEEGKMMRITISGKAVFYVAPDKTVLLDHSME